MKSILVGTVATALTASLALGGTPTLLNLSVESGGSSAIDVAPGEVVSYQVIGSLSNPDNQGLALFGFDACFSCNGTPENLSEMTLPATTCMENFELPLGITNPVRDDGLGGVTGGFGGTRGVSGQVKCLTQVGAATNTINNVDTNAPYPLGVVCLDIGLVPTVLAEGTLTIPAGAAPGTVCTVVLGSAFANVVRAGETDDGTFWAVDPVDQGALTELRMTVVNSVLSSNPDCDDTAPRRANNVFFLTFVADLTVAAPITGQVRIEELDVGGGFTGGDLSGSFSFSIINDGGGNPRVLRVQENGEVMVDQKWYTIRNAGWGGIGAFKRDFLLRVGDANNDGLVLPDDLSLINSEVSFFPAADDSRSNINGDNFVLSDDISLANAFVSFFPPPGKPSGHFCSP